MRKEGAWLAPPPHAGVKSRRRASGPPRRQLGPPQAPRCMWHAHWRRGWLGRRSPSAGRPAATPSSPLGGSHPGPRLSPGLEGPASWRTSRDCQGRSAVDGHRAWARHPSSRFLLPAGGQELVHASPSRPRPQRKEPALGSSWEAALWVRGLSPPPSPAQCLQAEPPPSLHRPHPQPGPRSCLEHTVTVHGPGNYRTGLRPLFLFFFFPSKLLSEHKKQNLCGKFTKQRRRT